MLRTTYTPKFETSLKRIGKKHYKRNKIDFEELLQYLGNLDKLLQQEKYVPDNHFEPFPKAFRAHEGLKLWKHKFKVPGLNGAAQAGRIIYLIDQPRKMLAYILIYTHAEYPKRPKDKELVRLLSDTVSTSLH